MSGEQPQENKSQSRAEEPEKNADRKAEGPRGADTTSPSDQRRSAWNKAKKNRGQMVNAGRIQGGVHYHRHTGEQATRRLRQTAEVSNERVKQVMSTFCPTDTKKYSDFCVEFAELRTGIITGKPGTGRMITAVHALASHRPRPRLKQLSLDPEDRYAGAGHIDLEADYSYYLDLTPFTELHETHEVALRSLVGEARRTGCLFLLIARQDQAQALADDVGAGLHIDRPARAIDVFDRVMRHKCGETDAGRWVDDRKLRGALEGAEPARALRLAHEARRYRPTGTLREEDYTTWIKEVLEKWSDATEELARWFNRHKMDSEFRRVLLTTVAVLEGGSRRTIAHQADRLAQTWHIPSLWRTPISGEGLTAGLWEAWAHVREDEVHFNRSGSGDEVLDYLWREHPRTRGSLLEWAATAVEDLPPQRRLEAAHRWLRLARRHRDVAPVRFLIHRWGASATLMWEAVSVIAEAAVTPELGPQVRSALYKAVERVGSSMRDRTVLEVCRVYGRVRPESALSRVRLIMEKASATWDQSLAHALQDIAREPGNGAVVLRSLCSWTSGPEKGRRKAVAAIALSSVLGDQGSDGVPVVLDRGLGAVELAATWRVLSGSGNKVGRPLWSWFDFLHTGGHRRKEAFEVLWSVGRDDKAFCRALENSVRRWKSAHGIEETDVDQLMETLKESEADR